MAHTKPRKSAWQKPLISQEVSALCGSSRKLNIINNLPADKYMERFAKAAKRHGFKAQFLASGRIIYYLGKGPQKISLMSGIHGEERAGPIALLTWLETARKGKLIDKKKISLMICPLVGHDAWNKRFRLENGKINLNSVWARDRAPRYVHEIKRAIENFEPTIFVDFHEDSTITDKEPYIWRNQAAKGIILNLQHAFGCPPKKGLWKSPQFKGTTETFVYISTGCLETTTIETPQTKLLRSRVGFDLAVLKWIVKQA